MIPALIVFILLIALGSMWGLASYEGAHAQALQAQALITANQTTQVSVIGQTVLGVVLAVLVLTILVLILVGLFLLKRRPSQPVQGGQWQSGPNARWQRNAQIPGQGNPALEMSPQALLMQQQMMQQQILTLWLLRQMGGNPPEMAALPEPQTLDVQSEPPWWE
jgi:hypothetical protein